MFVVTPNLGTKTSDFLKDLYLVHVSNSEVILPAPAHPRLHTLFYTATFQFCFLYSSLLTCVLLLRFVASSSLYKKVRNSIAIVFWLALGVNTYSLREEITTHATVSIYMTYFIYSLAIFLGGIVSFVAVYYKLGRKATIESIVLDYVKKHKFKIRVSECAMELGITEEQAKETLALLEKKGFIKTKK